MSRVRFRAARDLSIRVHGRDAGSIPATEENLIWRIARGLGADSVEMEIDNAIPLGKGLGSSQPEAGYSWYAGI